MKLQPIHPSRAKKPPDSPAVSEKSGVIARVLLAIPGSYAVTAIWVSLLAQVLPGGALSGSLTAMMLSFALCTLCIIGIFAARSALRAALWMAALAACGWAGTLAVGVLRASA